MLRANLDPLSRSFDDVLYGWQARYDGKPISVNFRKIVGSNSGVDRFTHLMHPYPAKLLLNIPLFFLNCSQLSPANGVLFDPFCGSGTVLLEGILNGRSVIGCDTNPLARIISQAKTTLLSGRQLSECLETVLSGIPKRGNGLPSGPIGIDQWFSPSVLKQLDCMASSIQALPQSPQKTFMEVCLSATISKVSLSDPTVSVPVKLNPAKRSLTRAQRAKQRIILADRASANVRLVFEKITETNIARMFRLEEHLNNASLACSSVTLGNDARDTSTQFQADLVITSPPYGSAQKYIRASSLSLQLLGFAEDGLRPLERKTIGREHYSLDDIGGALPVVAPSSIDVLARIGRRNPLRQHIAKSFLAEMHAALLITKRRLKKRGHLVMVIGNNRVCGQVFDTRRYMIEICEKLGLELILELQDRIRSRGLITKRNATAGMIARESILIFCKL